MQSVPLSADTVVGQIVEHTVKAVASQHNLSVGCAIAYQSAMNIYSCVAMKIECQAWC